MSSSDTSSVLGSSANGGPSASSPPLTPPSLALHHTLFSSWYPRFRSISPKATIIPLNAIQPDFLAWLEADTIVLPKGSGARKPRSAAPPPNNDGSDVEVMSAPSDSDTDSDDDDTDDGQDAEHAPPAPTFTALDAAIRTAIDRYDGVVFPKLNWSAPQDAAWILPGSTLRCSTPEDVYLVLKSSDFVTKDVEQAHELILLRRDEEALRQQAEVRPDTTTTTTTTTATSSTAPLERATHQLTLQPPPSAPAPQLDLVLKKYFEMPKSHEFRCFVRCNQLLCLSQRDITFFEHLQPREVQRTVRRRIRDFFHTHLQQQQRRRRRRPVAATGTGSTGGGGGAEGGPEAEGRGMPIEDYVFDAYLTRDMGRVFLVDVNPFLPRTDPILWSWEELDVLARRAYAANGGGEAADADGTAAVPDQGPDRLHPASTEPAHPPPSQDGAPLPHPPSTAGQNSHPPIPLNPGQSEPDDADASSSSSSSSFEEDEDEDEQGHPLPPLRLIASHAQASQSFPTYSKNMMPKEVIDVSSGAGIAEFARNWNEQIARAREGEREGTTSSDEDEDEDE